MNIKRFALSSLSAYVFLFLYEWVFHGMVLKTSYEASAEVWRSPEQMQEFFPLITAFQIIFVLFISFIFTTNYEEKGMGEGLRFGLFIGLFIGMMMASFYPYIPMPKELAIAWLVGGTIEGLGIGLVLSLVYKK